VEPYLLGYRLALGFDIYGRQQLPTHYISYQTDTLGAGLRLGFALREDLSLQARYSIYRQSIVLPNYLHDCNNINPDFISTFPTPGAFNNGNPATTFPGLAGTGTTKHQLLFQWRPRYRSRWAPERTGHPSSRPLIYNRLTTIAIRPRHGGFAQPGCRRRRRRVRFLRETADFQRYYGDQRGRRRAAPGAHDQRI
jgi:hypothetical protein